MPGRTVSGSTPPAQGSGAIGEEWALAAIVRSSHDAVIAKSVDGLVTAWNEGAHLLYGYPPEAILGRSIELTIPPAAIEEERARHARVATGEADSGYRCVRVRSDGQPVEVVMSMSPIHDAGGLVVGVASISRPVSDKERVEARFASLLDAAPDAIICVDGQGRIAMVNAQVSAVFGYSPDELQGLPVETLLPENVRHGHLTHQADFRTRPEHRSMGLGLDLWARRRDGSTFPVEVSLAPSTYDGDAMVIAAVRDVSAQRAIEANARDNAARFRQLAESVDIVFVLLQLDPFAYLYVSPGCTNIMGLDPSELMANPALANGLVHPEDRDRVAALWFTKTRAGEPAVSEHRIVRPDGSMCWIRSSATPVADSGNKPRRAVITVENISERIHAGEALREAEAAARAANDAKSEFLSRMSHELRTPLNAVLGFGQLLERQLAGTVHAEAVGHILKGGRHLLDLINDVLDIARIESGEMSMSKEPVPVAALIDETVALMRPLADAAGVTLTASAAPGHLYAHADRQRLRQIMLNLLSNAVKYNRDGGNVWISTAASGAGELTLRVRDDGPGIPTALQDRVFTAFDRLGAEGRDVEGTGIGLALTRSLTELMGGTVALTDEPAGGCCFTVTLPRTESPQSERRTITLPASAGPAAAAPLTTPATLLYIEDNEPNVRVVAHLLALRPGWTMIHAGLGGLGLELAQAHRPDVILLDLHLPDRSGHDVLTALKGNPLTSAIPVAVLSADANVSHSRRLLDAGAIRYLTKPLVIDEIFDLLDRVNAEKVGGRG